MFLQDEWYDGKSLWCCYCFIIPFCFGFSLLSHKDQCVKVLTQTLCITPSEHPLHPSCVDLIMWKVGAGLRPALQASSTCVPVQGDVRYTGVCLCISVNQENWGDHRGRDKHVLSYCFVEVVWFPRQAHVPPLPTENRMHCGSARAFDFSLESVQHPHVWNHVQFRRSIPDDQSLACFSIRKRCFTNLLQDWGSGKHGKKRVWMWHWATSMTGVK